MSARILWEEQGGLCWYCERRVPSPDNLRLTHRRCNLARRYEEWAAVDEFMARGGVI